MRAFKNSVNRATTASFRGSKMRGTEQMNKHRAKPCRYGQGSSARDPGRGPASALRRGAGAPPPLHVLQELVLKPGLR